MKRPPIRIQVLQFFPWVTDVENYWTTALSLTSSEELMLSVCQHWKAVTLFRMVLLHLLIGPTGGQSRKKFVTQQRR